LPDSSAEPSAPQIETHVAVVGTVESEGRRDQRNTFETVRFSAEWDTSRPVLIKTTEADLRNILHTHLEALTARDRWVPPLTVIVAIGVALASGVKSHTGKYALVFGLGMSVLWFAYTARKAWQCRKHAGIDAVIAELQPGSAVVTRPASSPAPSGYSRRLWAAIRGRAL
jgi:hypothetical protein